jgi:hypothetical protein
VLAGGLDYHAAQIDRPFLRQQREALLRGA